MHRIALASFAVAAFGCMLAGGIASADTSITPTVDATLIAIEAEHPLAGEWMVTTADGLVPAIFGADGSVLLKFPASVIGDEGFAFVNTAFGTWEPIGDRGASFTAVQHISHANGVYLGTATIDGFLTMSDDPSMTHVVASLIGTTVRDPRNNIVWVVNADAVQAAMTATRTVPATAGSFAGGGRALDPGALLGNGGRDCAGCAVRYAPDNVTPIGVSSVAVGSAASTAGPFEAHGANLARGSAAIVADPGAILGNGGRDCTDCAVTTVVEPAAVGPSRGGGCNTCR